MDIGGGHVLHSKFPEVLDWIFDHIPQDQFNKYDTKVLIDLEGHPVEFPIELNLWQLPTDLQVEYLYSYLTAASKDVKYENFESWIRNYLGDKIADNYMIPYNKKLWCIDISKLNTFEDLIKVGDLRIPEGIEILADSDEIIAQVTPPRSEEELEKMEEQVS